MKYGARLSLWAIPMFTSVALADSKSVIPPTINLEWSKRTYQVAAPAPFGDVQVTISIGRGRRVEDLDIWVGSDPVDIPPEVYADLKNPGEIDIAYADPSQAESKSVEYIVVGFEAGDSYRIEYDVDIAGCESPCFDTVRDIVQIRVNADRSIQSKISSLRHLGDDGA